MAVDLTDSPPAADDADALRAAHTLLGRALALRAAQAARHHRAW